MSSHRQHTLAALAVLAACSGAPGQRLEGQVFEVASPSEGARLSVDAVPLLVRLTPPFAEATVQVRHGGVDLTDPLALRRERKERLGGGVDYIATLPLGGLPTGAQTLHIELTAPSGLTVVQPLVVDVARPPSALLLRADDGAGNPADARVIVLRDGAPQQVSGPDGIDPWGRDLAQDAVMVVGGARTLHLEAGAYTLIATRGVRSAIDVQTVTVPTAEPVVFSLPRVVDTPGWLSADLHVHTGQSRDAFIPDRLRVESLAASGLDVAVITDHDQITDLSAPLSAALGAGHRLRSLPGVEATIEQAAPRQREGVSSIGHLNVFPLADGALPDTLPSSFAGLLSAFVSRQESHPHGTVTRPLTQLNHPRGVQVATEGPPSWKAHALFSSKGLDRSAPLDAAANRWLLVPDGGLRALDVDAIELLNRSTAEAYWQVRQDWFWLLNQGVQVTGTGNSDSHAAAVELAGFPVNLVRAPRPAAGEPLDAAAFTDAVREGALTVTTGPVLSLSLAGAGGERASIGERIRPQPGLVAEVRVRAAPWVPVDELRLIVDGEVAYREDLSAAERDGAGLLDVRREIAVRDGAGWVVAEAGWPVAEPAPEAPVERLGVYARVAPHYLPLAFTNPVFVEE